MLLSATLLWGLNITVLKWLTGFFDPVLLSAVRMATAILPMLVLLRYWRSWQWPARSQWAQIAVCGFLMVYLNQYLLASGLSRSTATNGSLITALSPLMAAVLALWLLRESIGKLRLLGVAIGLMGVMLVVLNRPGAELAHGGLGDAMLILAVLVFTLGALLIQRLSTGLNAVVIGTCVHAVGAVFLFLHVLADMAWTGQAPQMAGSGGLWAIAIVSGMLSTGIGNLLWNRSIGLVGMARASVWLYWVPLFGVASAALLLREPLTLWHALGLLLVFGGTHLGTLGAGVRPNAGRGA